MRLARPGERRDGGGVERLPAEQVERGDIDSMLSTLARTDLIDAAPDTVQALLQAITVKIDVRSRGCITPTFRIPNIPQARTPAAADTNPKVGALPGLVPPGRLVQHLQHSTAC